MFAGKFMQRAIKGDELGFGGQREGQQPAVSHPLGGLFGGEGQSGLPEFSFEVARLRVILYARVLEPSVVDGPSLAKRQRPVAHDSRVGEEAKQSKLRVAGEDEARTVRQAIEPSPGNRVVRMAVDGERKPDVKVNK